jgi:hypothetical protein
MLGKSLLVTLENPVKASLQRENMPDKPLLIDETITSRPSTPPWVACADLLISAKERTWVGLCYRVSESYQDSVKIFCSNLSTQIIRYNDLSSVESQDLYKDFPPEFDWVEIKWTDITADTVEVEQLDSGFWYYNEFAKNIQAVAFALDDIDEVVQRYSLKFPSLDSFAHFQPRFA